MPLLTLSDDESGLIDAMRSDLMSARFPLELRDCYYNGEQVIRDLKISIPPQLQGLHTVIGWPQIGVDALEQRLDIEAWRYAGDPASSGELDEITTANQLLAESELGHLDSFIYGRAYAAVGSGEDPETPPLITIESPMDMTVDYDARLRAVRSALRIYKVGDEQAATLYLPDQTVYVVQSD